MGSGQSAERDEAGQRTGDERWDVSCPSWQSGSKKKSAGRKQEMEPRMELLEGRPIGGARARPLRQGGSRRQAITLGRIGQAVAGQGVSAMQPRRPHQKSFREPQPTF